jgi:uncharacterized repeat protein (TIGR01451 family)
MNMWLQRTTKLSKQCISQGYAVLMHRKVPQISLVVFLHIAPICKVICTASSGVGSSPAAIVLRWAAAIAAMIGTYHTVSAASAAIVGLTKYNNNTPVGGPTNNAVALEGQTFRYRITVSNAGSDHNKDYFNCVPLPPGLTMNTNLGGNGFITNVANSATVAGVYHVRLYAGNTSYPRPVTYDATITITGTTVAPTITASPTSQTATEGDTVTFNVTANGTQPFTYEWFFGPNSIPGATNASLSLATVTSTHAGTYHVVVRNSAGSATSADAELVVQTGAPLMLENPHFEGGSFVLDTSGPNNAICILWASTDASAWTPVATNTISSGKCQFADPVGGNLKRFYYVTKVP